MSDINQLSTTKEKSWPAWVITASGFVIGPLSIWLAMRFGASAQSITRLEYFLFTVAVLGIAASRLCMNRYERRLKPYRMTYQYHVPGAYGQTKIEQTYKYQTELFSSEDKKIYKSMQAFSYSGIFFLSILGGSTLVVLHSVYLGK